MKKLLFIIGLFISFVSDAQQYTPMTAYGYDFKRIKVGSDTITTKEGISRVGTVLYAGNGTYWTAQGGGSGSVDSTIFATIYNLYRVLDSTLTLYTFAAPIHNWNDTIRVDTVGSAPGVVTPEMKVGWDGKMDSLHLYGNDVYYFKNGDSSFAFSLTDVVTLQKAFDNAPAASPQINAHMSDVLIDSTKTFTVYSQSSQVDKVSGIYSDSSHVVITSNDPYRDNPTFSQLVTTPTYMSGIIYYPVSGAYPSFMLDSSGKFTVGANIVPNYGDLKFSVGIDTARWQNIYLKDTGLHVGNAVITDSGYATGKTLIISPTGHATWQAPTGGGSSVGDSLVTAYANIALKKDKSDSTNPTGYKTVFSARKDSTLLSGLINSNTASIATNTSNISTNTTNIAANTASLLTKWGTSGNSGLTAANFIGTTDNHSTVIKSNNIKGIIVDSLGNVGINNYPNKDTVVGDPPHLFQIVNDNTRFQMFSMISCGNSSVYGNNMHYCRNDGTYASPTNVKNGFFIKSEGFRGFDGTAWSQSAGAEQVLSDGDWSTSNHGIRFQWQATKVGSTTRVQAMTLFGTGNLKISTDTTDNGHKLEINPGTLVDQKNALKLIATMPSSATSFNSAINSQITSASNAQNQYSFNMDLLAGGTDAKIYAAVRGHSAVAGTGANLSGVIGNYGLFGNADATTTGYNVGVYGFSSAGTISAGVVGRAITANNSKRNIGGAFFANNSGTATAATGLYVGMNTTDPTFADGALLVDNASVAAPIAIFRDNGTAKFTIADGGNPQLALGNKLEIATGTNASIGVSGAMTAGTITISTTAVTASSKIFLTTNTPGGTIGILSAPTASIVAGTSFVINSSSALDTSTVNWWIVN